MIAGLAASNIASAQNADGMGGWTSPAGPAGTFDSAAAACEAQWKKFMDNGYSRFIGASPSANDWTFASCKWTSFQYLCPQETGGDIGNCGTILPSSVSFNCLSGYTATADGHCRQNPPPEKPCNCQPGRLNPTTPNPIVISTGAKFFSELDFETADGRFRIGRKYRSFQVGRPIEGTVLPRSQPRGLAGGWNLDLGYEIQLGTFSGSPATPTAKVAVLAPDGTGYGFVLQSSGEWVPDPAAGAANASPDLKLEYVGTLPANLADVKTAASSWKVIDGEDSMWSIQTRVGPNGGSYNRGWPVQMAARGGYQWNYTYNSDSSLASITDSFGRTANFTWYKFYISSLASPPAGSLPTPQAISAIDLPDGTSLRYSYDPPPAIAPPSSSVIQRLVKVERLSAASAVLNSITYLYEDNRFPTHVTGIVDNGGVRTRTYSYDSKGRATSSQAPAGESPYTVEYGTSGSAATRRVTNPLGKAENYTFALYTGAGPVDYRLSQIAGEASAGTSASTSSTGYGTNTFINSSTDEEGAVTTTTRDGRGRPTTIVEGSGTSSQRTTTITWHASFDLPATVVRQGLTEAYTYDTFGNLVTATQTDTTTQTVAYSTNGQSRTWTYTWNANGQLTSTNGPLPPDALGHDDITSYAYDTSGNLLTLTNALGQVTSFSGHDASGHPGSMTDPNGIATSYSYDPLGHVTGLTVHHPSNSSHDATTTVTYDAVGRVSSLTLPSTDTLFTDYDAAGRVSAMRAASGERWDFSYDAVGNVVSESVKRTDGSLARQVKRAFDELGRLVSEATATGHTTRWSYDKAGRPTATVSPNGFATTAAFDPLGRVVSTLAPDGGTAASTYDQQDNELTFTDPVAVTTTFVYNGFGEVIREVSPDRGTSTYWYNNAGQLVSASDGRGQIVDYSLDLLGRTVSKAPQGRPASEAVQYVWDAGGLSGSYSVGRLAAVIDGSGTTAFGYDHRGNLLAKQQTIGASGSAQLLYEYDLADRITRITYPSGRIVHYGYDSKGRVNLVETKASAAIVPWTTLASGYAYEPFGAVKVMALGNGLAVANDWGGEARLASRRLYRPVDNVSLSYLAYRYDADGNIASITDLVNDANSLIYGYDSMGRVALAVASGGGGSQSYTYPGGTNRMASLTDASGTRTVTYDGRGNTASESRPGSVAVTAGYDGYARLVSYQRSGTSNLAFAYNGLDDRISMTDGLGTRRFVYDASGRVMGEYGLSAADVKAEFIWAGPQVGAGGAFGGDDGLGGYMPLAVANPDGTGTVQLNWVHGGHLGVPLVITDPSGNAVTTPGDYLAPGFPGQSRVLADLYYNRYRDYDPVTGRYIQADPIGLGGGSNDYGYVEGNPINRVDPWGLQAVRPAPGSIPIWVPRLPICDVIWCPGQDFWKPSPLTKWILNCFDDDDDDDGDVCYNRWNREDSKCSQWSFHGPRAVQACRSRAAYRRNLCVANRGRPNPSEPPEWDPWKDWYGEQDDIDP